MLEAVTVIDRLRLRHEEAYGLAETLRARHPLAAQELDAYCLGLSTALHDLDPPEKAPPAEAGQAPSALAEVGQGEPAPAPPAVVAKPPAAKAPPPAVPTAPPAERPSPTPSAAEESTHYTPERKALITALWGDLSVSVAGILERVNALPGTRIASPAALYQGVRNRCGLPGSRTAYADQLVAAPAPAIPAEDIAAAREMLRAKSVGARALAEHFGWPLDHAQEIAETLRAEIAAAAAEGAEPDA